MKNFIFILKVTGSIMLLSFGIALLNSCESSTADDLSVQRPVPDPVSEITPESVARMISGLPLTIDHVQEVWNGVNASSANGYDEEYPFKNLFESPGTGIGDEETGSLSRAGSSATMSDATSPAFRDLFFAAGVSTLTRSVYSELSESGLQIYWPYSENWDQKTLPVITFCPDEPREKNVGFSRREHTDGSWEIEEIMVDEAFAASHPVWVVNYNTDAEALTPQMMEKMGKVSNASSSDIPTKATRNFRTLRLKEFKAHRQYDPWLSGGSEFFIKTGALKAFTADVASDMKYYKPEITDLMIKVKRSQVGKALRYNTILFSDWSDQLDECAFMLTEDDGGKMTSWKSSGLVKIKSKSYGFEVEIPYHRNDDIVWRGKLSASYFQRYNDVPNRFGDVSITFTFN